jgi:tetratricopeptide (TPR) repeat protein
MVLNFLAIGQQAAFADSNAIQTELDAGAAAAQAGKMDSAEKSFQKAFDGASAANDQMRLCQASLQLGIIEITLHKYAQAEKALLTGVKIVSAVMPPNSPFAAVLNSILADLYLQESRPAQALQLYLAAMPNLPTAPANMQAEKMVNLALCYDRLDKVDLAEATFQKAIAAFTSAVGPDDAQTVRAIVNYGLFQFARGNDQKAIDLAQRVLSSKSADKGMKARANNTLAHVYDRQEKYGKALKIAQSSLDEFKTSGSTDLVDRAGAWLTIGRIYKHGHKYRDAEVAIDKALDLLKGYPDNADYSDGIREKSELFMLQGQYDKAELLANQSKSLREKYVGADNSDVAQNLADLGYIYQQQNKFDDAETAYKKALRIYKNGRGERDPLYIETLAKLAELYRLMGRNSEAANNLSSVLELRRSTLPSNDPKIARTIVALASVYKEDHQAAKAEELLTDLVSKDQSAANQAQKAGLLQELASAQIAEGKSDQAASTTQRATAMLGKLFDASGLNNSSGADLKNDVAAGTATGAFSAAGAITAAGASTSSSSAAITSATAGKANSAGPESSPEAPKGDKWCLAVGISNFKDSSINLKYSAKDATDFKDFLIAKGNFKPDHVKLLVDESATRQNLIDQLGKGWLANRVKPDDLVVIYISSHGSQATDDTKQLNFLVTYDTDLDSVLATGIPMQWLSKIVKDLVKSQHTLIMLDVCHSGSAADWSDDGSDSPRSKIASGGTTGGKGLQRKLTSDPHSVVPGAGQVILCSSAQSQNSWESQEYPNGVFTKRLMDALNSKGAGTKISDAFNVLKTNVEGEVLRDRNEMQTPQINTGGKAILLSPLSDVP